MTEKTNTVLIVAGDDVQSVTSEPGAEANIRVFADTDAITALQCISRECPEVVVLGRTFVDSPRGAALVNAIKVDNSLTNTQIRVISEASDYFSLVCQTDQPGASDDAMPGEPLPADYLGTRMARRFTLRPDFPVRVDGSPTTLVNLSETGAGLVGPTLLRLQRRVRLVMGTPPDVIRCAATVAWVSFEPRGKGAPRYRAGVHFIDLDPETINTLIARNITQ